MRRPPTGPKSRALALKRLSHTLAEQTREDEIVDELERSIPDAWAMLEADVACEGPKVKVTLYLDAPVAKFFRAMGKGYQARINRLLTIYAQAKIAEVRWFDEARDRETVATWKERRARKRGEEAG